MSRSKLLVRNATSHKQFEVRQDLMSDILRILNREHRGIADSVREVVGLIRQYTGFDAVGVRMRQGDDYPYYEQNGFPGDFVGKENLLCKRACDGSMVRDNTGQPVFECTCGLVLSGKTDPALPFFTVNGSFWTNCASALLSVPGHADPRMDPRNTCIHEGYQSFALIPIRSGPEIVGLLQLNDRREGQFSPESIQFFEGLGDQFGLALKRIQVQAELKALNASLEERVAMRTAESEQRAEQLRLLAAELTMVEERERQRLAEVLHDGLQQILAGAKYQLAAVEAGSQKRKAVAEVASLIDAAIETSRSLTAELSPPILHQSGFVAGLRWLRDWMHDRHGFRVQLLIDGSFGCLPAEISVFLFNGARELLFNVTKHAHTDFARVEVFRAGGNIRVVVDDNGTGFDQTRLRSEGGCCGGFGLFKLNERLSMLGGKMIVESSPDTGSRVTLILPETGIAGSAAGCADEVIASDLSGPNGGSADWKPDRKKTRIILVDDHSVMRHGLAVMLREHPDFEILGEASDGEAGISLVRQLKPDVVLMDISMPGMNGIEATQVIHSEHPEISVIGLSMFREGEQAAAMKSAGAVNYVAKSDPPENIISAIQACALH